VISRQCASCETAASKPVKPIKPVKSTNNSPPPPPPPPPPADHRQLAVEQELFTTSIFSPGSPLFLPNGTRIFTRLTAFLRAQYDHFGFQEVISPTIYKKSLWEKSGHWENYAEDMYSVQGRGASGEAEGKQVGEDEEYGLKPMNCPGHCLMFASKQRSFREMPVRFADFSPLHRNEISGALSGLTRVRRFHQDDGHIFCRPSQVADEISKTLEFVKMAYQTFNLGQYRLALSTRPKDHFIGTEEEWDRAENALQIALVASDQEWSINEGDGAFYGPKIDIILKDSDGKEHQTATIQLDFQLPKRFDLQYQAPAPDLEQKGLITTDPELLATSGPVRPVMIHRAILGSVERFMALLIEHYNGRWPVWLNPRQVMIITVSEDKDIVEFAHKAAQSIRTRDEPQSPYLPKIGKGFQIRNVAVDIDDTPRSVKKKISEAKRKRYSMIAVVGKKNVEGGKTLTVDLSALSDPYGIVRRFYWLKQWAGSKNRPPLPEGYSDSQTIPVGHPIFPEVPANELKEMELAPKALRELIFQFEGRYQ
jgi:threonyl-tRNA synthetase